MKDEFISWDNIHRSGLHARTSKQKQIFSEIVREMAKIMPCSKCRDHMKHFIRQYPPEYENDCFEWTWQLHNEVNSILGKPQVSYEEAYNRYV